MHSPNKGSHADKEHRSIAEATTEQETLEQSMPSSARSGIAANDLIYRNYLNLNVLSQPLSMTHSQSLQQGSPQSYMIHPIYSQAQQQGPLPGGGYPHNSFAGPNLNSPPSITSAGQQYNQIDPVDNVSDSPNLGALQQQRRRKIIKKAWTRLECILLLQCAKKLIHCDLKTIAEAAYECIGRSAEICSNRAAEKKLKRLLHFHSWKKSNKKTILAAIDKELMELDVKPNVFDSRVIKVTEPLMGAMIIEDQNQDQDEEEPKSTQSADNMQLDTNRDKALRSSEKNEVEERAREANHSEPTAEEEPLTTSRA